MSKLFARSIHWAAVFAIVVACAPTWAQTDSGSPTQATDSQSATESIAEVYFMSRATHADGSQTIDLFGSLLIWLLLALSFVNLSLIGYLTLTTQRKGILPDGVVAEVRRLLSMGQHRQAFELTKQDASFFSRIVHAGLGDIGQGPAAVIRSLEQAADALIATRGRPIELLYMFGQVSPMLGLLGTVYGIIFAFRVFVAMGGRASPALLAGGIGTALVATFWGLVVAIPALAAYSMLRNKFDQLTTEAITLAEELLVKQRPKGPPSAKIQPAPKPTVQAES